LLHAWHLAWLFVGQALPVAGDPLSHLHVFLTHEVLFCDNEKPKLHDAQLEAPPFAHAAPLLAWPLSQLHLFKTQAVRSALKEWESGHETHLAPLCCGQSLPLAPSPPEQVHILVSHSLLSSLLMYSPSGQLVHRSSPF
jgi:hypothetical protein